MTHARNNTVDVARGIAFGCMLVHHVFYFPSIDGVQDIPRVVEVCGSVARHLFIVLAGFSLAVQFRAPTDLGRTWRKRLWRCAEVGMHAAVVSLVTYAFYPDRWVRFGILHFMSVALLLASTLLLSAHHELLALGVIVGLSVFPATGTWLDVALGSRKHYEYGMLDFFPLASWFPWLWMGVLLGKYIPLPSVTASTGALSGLTWVGQYSLPLYTAHFVLFCAASRYGNIG
jgi:uncharacterized membrane protein